MGLVQSNIVDYERLRREKGAGTVVREVLDTHYAMSYDAVERQKAQALLWSETVYPTTFGQPKSEASAELDREILGIVNAAGVPLVFGTYDRDRDRDRDRDPDGAGGEYNAAAFVAPGMGLVGVYRKTRLFPFTKALPAWLDGPLQPLVRRWLPWAGTWRPGTGARVFPLRLADGREIPVLPLLCQDDVDTGLAIDGARLGARVILTMSNDSWFTEHAQGAQLHLAVAAFCSIETRLPQFRVTSNGYSAVIDARGEVLAGTRHGERTLVVGELPVRDPSRTLIVAWGDWVGRAGAVFMLALGVPGRSSRPRAMSPTT
jgi:apolipoprotein N-acyltransferase